MRALTAFQTLIPLVPWFRRSARSASAPLVPVVPVPAPVVSRVPRVVRPSVCFLSVSCLVVFENEGHVTHATIFMVKD